MKETWENENYHNNDDKLYQILSNSLYLKNFHAGISMLTIIVNTGCNLSRIPFSNLSVTSHATMLEFLTGEEVKRLDATSTMVSSARSCQ